MNYYIIENGTPAGPFGVNELLGHGLTLESKVWNEHMDSWTTAGTIAELYEAVTGHAMPPAGAQMSSVVASVAAAAATRDNNQAANRPSPQISDASAQPVVVVPIVDDMEETQVAQPQLNDYSAPSAAQQPLPPAPQGYSSQGYPSQGYQPQGYPQQNYQAQGHPQQGYQPQSPNAQYGVGKPDWKKTIDVNTYMLPSVLLTVGSVLCCLSPVSLIFGIIAIAKASQSKGAQAAGDIEQANKAANSARTMCIVGAVTLVLWLIMLMVIGANVESEA